MSLLITSITITTPQLDDMLRFYRIVGFAFEVAKVDKGSEIYKALHNGIEFSLYATGKGSAARVPSLQLGFSVASLDKTVAELLKVPHVTCILDPVEMGGRRQAIVLDPDGHSIELTERA